jgi:intein/homing endonuclease
MSNRRKKLDISGSNLWYLVGLITTDGCLSSDGRHIDITSKDYKFLALVKDSIGINNKIGFKYNGRKQEYFHIQIGNKNLYEFLVSIGLTPNKSLTLEKVKVPDKYFVDFLRGIIDGDGCIRKWSHSLNHAEQWSLRIFSGSRRFIEWLSWATEALLRAKGRIYNEKHSNLWTLKYGKMAARRIVSNCYYKNCLGLTRKIKLAQECIRSYAGWSKSNTVSSICL